MIIALAMESAARAAAASCDAHAGWSGGANMRVVSSRLTGPDRYEAKGGGPMISMPPLCFAERMTRSKSTVRSVSAISFNAALAPR